MGRCVLVDEKVFEFHVEVRLVLRTGKVPKRVPGDMGKMKWMVAIAPLSVGAWFELSGRFFCWNLKVSYLIGFERL